MHELRRTTGAFLLQPKIFSLYGIFYYLCKLNCKNAVFYGKEQRVPPRHAVHEFILSPEKQ